MAEAGHSIIHTRLLTAVFGILLLVSLPERTRATEVMVQLESVDREHVRVVMTNQSGEPVFFLRWGSPFEESLSSDLFRVQTTDSQQTAAFTGRFIKRESPLPDDFVVLPSGATIDAVIRLAQYYRLPWSGEFEVSLSWSVQLLTDSRVIGVSKTSNTIITDLFNPPVTIAALPPVYDSCTIVQQSLLQETFDEAENITVEARDGLAGLTEDGRYNSPRYKQWFGAYAPERFERVLGTYNNIIDVLDSRTVRLSCGCDRSGWFAYVYPALEFDIYLCPAFWRAPLVGRDSRAGTLIHELTHFPSINGTSDHAYSTEAASLTPDLAIDNADNYEYFAENVPALPIFNGVEFSWLAIDVEMTGSLQTGQSNFYKVAGVDVVELFSDSGDADLFVYATAAAEKPLCSAIADGDSGHSADRCETVRNVVSYIEVVAVIDTSFRLIAKTLPVVDPQTDEVGSDQVDLPGDVILSEIPSVADDGTNSESADIVRTGIGTMTGSGVLLLVSFLLCSCVRRLIFRHD